MRAIRDENNYKVQDKQKNMEIQDIIYAQGYGGSIFGRGTFSTFSAYKPPPGCPYLGKYNYDSRCRTWVIQPSKQNQITPIEPNIVLSGNTPFYATNFCKSQRSYEKDVNGNMVSTNCTYSVSCIVVKLLSIKNYFDQNNFYNSTTIMIDPRSQILVYNQLQNNTQSTTRLVNATFQIFPNDTQTQNQFSQQIVQKMQRNNHPIGFDSTKERLILDEKKQCSFDPFQTEKILHIQPVQYGNYAFTLPKIELNNKTNSLSKSFLLRPGESDEVFVTMNYISIVEKQKDKFEKKQLEIQDLFIIVSVLPKNVLTSETDKLKVKIHQYLIWVSIGSLILCGFLIITAAVISYQVAVKIEKPLIHMTAVLNILDQEGCGAAIDLIDSEIADIDSIFLSQDSKILFDSFKKIIEMLQLATEDIFTVSDSCSLIRLNYQINFFKKFNNMRVLGICYNNMGNIHFQNGRYFESMEAYQYAIILAQQEAGFYSEYYNDEFCQSQEYQANREIREYSKEVRQTKQKLSQTYTFFAMLKKSLSTSLFMDKRMSDQISIDQQLNTEDNNRLKYQNVSQGIKEIIFDRKFNYSHALYMHNITQQTEGLVIQGNISSKVLDNPINCKKSQYSQNWTSSAKVIFEWENYEGILLDLIELSSQLKMNSFGRTVILFSQLSLCHLKMGKIEQASMEQSIAIDNYHCAIKFQELKDKHGNQKGQQNSIQEGQQDLLELNINTQIIDKKKEILEGFDYNPTQRPPTNSHKESMILDNQTLGDQKSTGKYLIELEDDLSLLSQFKKRQTIVKKRMEQSNEIRKINASIADSFIKSFQGDKENSIELQISQNEQYFNFRGTRIQSAISSRSNYAKETRISDASLKKDEQNLSPIKNKLVQKNQTKPSPNKKKKINFNERYSSKSDPLEKFQKQKKSFTKIQMKSRDQSYISTLQTLKKNMNSQSEFENNEENQKKEGKQIYDQISQRSDFLNSKKQKNISSEQDAISEATKILFSSQLPSLHKKPVRSKKRNNYLNSKVNKQLLQEDLEQIQRYELPSDILLYYITLQESRLLILENYQMHSAFILTDLLEKTKYYLPYFRLACLEVLSNITKSNEQTQFQINKLKKRFDLDIQFNAAIAVLVKSGKEDAFNTIITLVNDVFTKDEDILSLLLYEKNSFQQIIPSISLQQLRLTGGYFEQYLAQISSKNNLQRQCPIQEANLAFSTFLNPSQNQKQESEENQGNIQIEYLKILKDNHSQNKQLIQKRIDFSEDPIKNGQIIQVVPTLKNRITFSELTLRTNFDKDEKDKLMKDYSPTPLKKCNQQSELSPQTFKNSFRNYKEEIIKLSDVKQENSENHLIQNNMRKEENQGQIMEDQLLNPSSSSQIFDSNCSKIKCNSKNKNSPNNNNNNNNNNYFSFKDQRKPSLYFLEPKKTTKETNLNNIQSLCEIENNFKETQNSSLFSMNLIFHLAARQCIQNFFYQDQNKYEIHQKSIQEGIYCKQKKFMIFITDKLEITISKAYQMLSNLLYSTQARLLILLLNEEEYLEEDYVFKDVSINGKTVIKYFYTQDKLIQYVRNKRELMKNFGVPVLVEHLNM